MNEIVDLTDEMIKRVLTAEKELNLFITAHLYLEHFLDLAVDKHFPLQEHLLDVPYFSTDLKLRILHGNGFLTDILYLNGKMMNEIRNKFAHNLNPNQQSIGAKIEKMMLPWHSTEIVKGMDKFEKYKNVAVVTITNVKNALEEDRNTNFYPDVKIPESEK
ncbi:MAG: hypothetical protein GTN97_04515 [Nitrosopumilaceae archaeon]|nr:hypothetical protein [Nitrosopumilaceae archaeon]NIP10303.1 hypothetical protein [Nitrosopumilaceae archaeon]NIS95166.1 hypothetical protein [Nitrosopumilaceae archaeon]